MSLAAFCKANHLEPGMGRRGNCRDNAVAESLCFSSFRRSVIKNISMLIENRHFEPDLLLLMTSTILLDGIVILVA